MRGSVFRAIVAVAFLALILGGAWAQDEQERGMGRSEKPSGQPAAITEWSLNTALEGERRPFLCRDRDSVELVVEIMARALGARESDSGKAQRLTEIAGRLQAEICTRPAAEDIIILRCNIAQRDLPRAHISTIKVSAVIRNEPSKGEQPFFAWTYLDIVGNKDATPETRSAAARWCGGDDRGGDEALNTTPDMVLGVQRRLYDLGVRVPHINGVMTTETIQAVVQFQKWANLPATGQLTRSTIQKISTMTPPSAWVAFAFDGQGNFGAERGGTRRGTETAAIERLQRVSKAAYQLSSVADGCIAIATTQYVDRRRRTTFTQAFTNAGPSAAAAAENVMTYCGREKGGGTCEVRKAVCADPADEQVERYNRKDMPANSPAPNLKFDPVDIPVNARPPGR